MSIFALLYTRVLFSRVICSVNTAGNELGDKHLLHFGSTYNGSKIL
jgi:hypothetical protein